MKEIIEAKKLISELILDILSEKTSVQNAIKRFPQDIKDESIECAFHAILHFEADEDYRKNDPEYADEQWDYLEYIADLFQRGEDLPLNIIQEYRKYYESAPLIGKNDIMSVLKNLFRLTI
ncbi:MAG TPA: hypothetical protein P5556_10825 [Candidatus Gastranaerophilales bacterium]|nr:hypothetical protein [Candidatus Gastranaerophilales bacterium]